MVKFLQGFFGNTIRITQAGNTAVLQSWNTSLFVISSFFEGQ